MSRIDPAHGLSARTAAIPLAVAWALGAGPVSAQTSTEQWAIDARFLTIDQVYDSDPAYERVQTGIVSGNANGIPLSGNTWTMTVDARPQASAVSRTLRSGIDVKLEMLDGWGSAEVIGQSSARWDDTLTVVGPAGGTAGLLEIEWSFTGTMDASLVSKTDRYGGALGFLGWEYHMQSELFAVGPDFGRVSMSSPDTLSRATTPTPATARNFTSHMPWEGAEVYDDDGEMSAEGGTRNPGGIKLLQVPVTAGTPLPLSLLLHTGVNIGLFNVDYYGIEARHSAIYWDSATLEGVRLLDASGAPYTGDWSVESAIGVDYPILAVPEPGAGWLWAGGLAAVLVAARPRRAP